MNPALPPADALGIFVKAPEAGRVKTRLAEAIGAGAAAALYRRLGREVVEQSVDPRSYHTAVWFAPRSTEASVRAWLHGLAVNAFLPQPARTLGGRLVAAYHRHFSEGAPRVIVIGSDAPGLGRFLVRRAFQALDRADLVIGPTLDGGFYLLGLRAPVPGLFWQVAWSTDRVCRKILTNAARLRVTTAELPELRDVDTVTDARALGLLPVRVAGTPDRIPSGP